MLARLTYMCVTHTHTLGNVCRQAYRRVILKNKNIECRNVNGRLAGVQGLAERECEKERTIQSALEIRREFLWCLQLMLNSPCPRGNYQRAEVDQVQHQEQEHRPYPLEQETSTTCRKSWRILYAETK